MKNIMLKNIKNKIYKPSDLKSKSSPGEIIRDEIIKAGLKIAEESGYAAGNTTEKLVNIAYKSGTVLDRGTELIGGGEASCALGNIVFKTTKDIVRGDTICTGLCIVSGTCETIALACSTVKVIPCRGRIYVCAKIVSKGLMTYRNACAGEGC